jgi:hypothetical protein
LRQSQKEDHPCGKSARVVMKSWTEYITAMGIWILPWANLQLRQKYK